MKRIVLLGFALLILSLLNCNVSAISGSGITVIDTTVTGEFKLNLSLQYPEIIIPENYYFFENLTVSQSDSKDISVYLNKSDTNDFVKFVNETGGGTYYQNDYTMDLSPYTYEDVRLRVYVPPGQGYNGGTYNVPIYVYSLSDQRSNSTILEINVNNTNPIDDVQILNLYPSSLYQGESLNADVSIHKIYPSETTDVQLCYCINPNPTYQCGPSYNNYGCEWKAIKVWLNYTKTVKVNEGPGEYYFFVAVEYPGDANIKRAISPKFLVKQIPGPPSGAPPIGPPVPPQPAFEIFAPEYLEASPGERIDFEVKIENTGNAKASNTVLNVYGVPESWVSVSPYVQDIEKGESKNYSVSISLPVTAPEQVYSLSLVGKSGAVEKTKVIKLTVAFTLEKLAKFLLEEAVSKRKEAEEIIESAKDLGMDTPDPENTLVYINILLEETQRLFESGDYEGSIGTAKDTIEGYKSVIDRTKEIVEEAYLSLLNQLADELGKTEKTTEEQDVVESIKEKLNQSMIFQREKRIIGAYETLLEAKQLLEQLKGKMFFRELTQNVVIISILAVMVVAASMVVFYKKRMSKFLKRVRIEDHKKTLKSLFGRKVRPDVSYRGKPRIDRENIDELHRLLEIGEALMDTDIDGAKEAYTKAKKIYGSLSTEEKRLVGEDVIRLTRLQNKLVKQSR